MEPILLDEQDSFLRQSIESGEIEVACFEEEEEEEDYAEQSDTSHVQDTFDGDDDDDAVSESTSNTIDYSLETPKFEQALKKLFPPSNDSSLCYLPVVFLDMLIRGYLPLESWSALARTCRYMKQVTEHAFCSLAARLEGGRASEESRLKLPGWSKIVKEMCSQSSLPQRTTMRGFGHFKVGRLTEAHQHFWKACFLYAHGPHNASKISCQRHAWLCCSMLLYLQDKQKDMSIDRQLQLLAHSVACSQYDNLPVEMKVIVLENAMVKVLRLRRPDVGQHLLRLSHGFPDDFLGRLASLEKRMHQTTQLPIDEPFDEESLNLPTCYRSLQPIPLEQCTKCSWCQATFHIRFTKDICIICMKTVS